MVGPGFKGCVDGGSLRCFAGLFEGDDLGMFEVVVGVEAFANDLAILDDDRARPLHRDWSAPRRVRQARVCAGYSQCLSWFDLGNKTGTLLPEEGPFSPKGRTGWLFNFRIIGCLNNHPVRSACGLHGHPSFEEGVLGPQPSYFRGKKRFHKVVS